MSTHVSSFKGSPKHSKTRKMNLRRSIIHNESGKYFTPSHHLYAYRKITETKHLEDDNGSKRRQKMQRRKDQPVAAREVPLLNLWYFASTISHILRRAKAFYNECCCDAYEERQSRKVEVTVVDPYFSVPAFPCTSVAY